MAELARNGRPLGRVLEIGTGCGYQAAVLGRIARQVYSMERLAALIRKARRNLRAAGVNNVHLRHGDGHAGMPEVAPFDAVVLAAAAPRPPDALLGQLDAGGRMVLPISRNDEQHLVLIERTARGVVERRMDPVVFVPLLSGVG
jgi:protein-L-isoaspartate(D-aspartate) O-methyltransferase